MKRILSISYWIAAMIVVATVMHSIGYRIPESFLVGTLFLPGAIAARFAFSKISSEDRRGRIRGGVCATVAILVGENLLLIVAHLIICSLRAGIDSYFEWPDLPSVLQNPIFIAIMLAALSVGSVFVDRLLEKRFPSGPKTVTFLSDRHSVTLRQNEILFVESNDAVTVVHSKDGAEYKNKTPISQWESILDCGFTRIHRSFIVNVSAVTSTDKDIVRIGDLELPVSRKYKSNLSAIDASAR